jgi:hypothetical protein
MTTLEKIISLISLAEIEAGVPIESDSQAPTDTVSGVDAAIFSTKMLVDATCGAQL